MANQDHHEDPKAVQAQKKPGALDVSKAVPVPQAPQLVPGGRRKTAIRYFGDYVLLGEIGRGGMGVIYRAFHRSVIGRTSPATAFQDLLDIAYFELTLGWLLAYLYHQADEPLPAFIEQASSRRCYYHVFC